MAWLDQWKSEEVISRRAAQFGNLKERCWQRMVAVTLDLINPVALAEFGNAIRFYGSLTLGKQGKGKPGLEAILRLAEFSATGVRRDEGAVALPDWLSGFSNCWSDHLVGRRDLCYPGVESIRIMKSWRFQIKFADSLIAKRFREELIARGEPAAVARKMCAPADKG